VFKSIIKKSHEWRSASICEGRAHMALHNLYCADVPCH